MSHRVWSSFPKFPPYSLLPIRSGDSSNHCKSSWITAGIDDPDPELTVSSWIAAAIVDPGPQLRVK